MAVAALGASGARVLGAVGGVLAARLLGPTGRGQIAVLMVVGTMAATAAACGLQFWVTREVARTQDVGAALPVVVRHAAMTMVTLPLIGLGCAPVLERFVGAGFTAVASTVVFAVAGALFMVFLAVPGGMRSMGAVAGATIAAAGVYVAVVTGLLIAGRASISLVVAGAALGQVMGTWIAWRSRPRHLGPVKECFLDWRRYRRALAFGAPGGVGEVVLFAMLRVDVLIVAAFLPLEAVGLYAVAAALTEVLFVVPDGVALVVLPTSARDPGSARIPHVLAVTAVVTGLGGLLLVALDRTVIDLLFGKAFVGAASAVPLLVVAAVAGGAWKVIGAEVVARGRTSPRLWSAGAGLVTMVLVDLVAIPRLGIVGAALGSACGYVAAAALLARSWLLRSRVVARPPARVAGYAAVGAATGVR